MAKIQKITPFLWFDTQAEEAALFYVSIFKKSKLKHVVRANGRAIVVQFILEGQEFSALNGGPQFRFTEAVSFMVSCKNQKEVDYFWEKLTADGGSEGQCGWLKDKYGLSWQIVPEALPKLMADSKKGPIAMTALMQMKKIVIILILFFFSISTIYYYGPSTKKQWKFVTPGSTLATLGSIIASLIFSPD